MGMPTGVHRAYGSPELPTAKFSIRWSLKVSEAGSAK